MTIERLLKGLRALGPRSWGDGCPDGFPVPSENHCRSVDCDSVPLPELRTGEKGTVTCLDDSGSRASKKLMAMGILPGASVRLVQRYPVYVFRVGYSEFAVDRDLGDLIRVRREAESDRRDDEAGSDPARRDASVG